MGTSRSRKCTSGNERDWSCGLGGERGKGVRCKVSLEQLSFTPILHKPLLHYPNTNPPYALLDLKLLPPAAGATFSFRDAAVVVFFAAAPVGALVVVAGFLAGTALLFVVGLTMVVPALLSLTPLLLPSASLLAAAGAFFVVCCRLAVLAPGLPTGAGFAGCTSWIDGFSGDPPALKGERGRVLEL